MSTVTFTADARDTTTPTIVYGEGHTATLADEAMVRLFNAQGKCALAGADIRKVRAPAVTATGSTIVFSLDVACTAVAVNYGTSTAYGSNQNATPTSQPPGEVNVTLSGLTTGTLYHYRVTATVGSAVTLTTDYTFTTL
jgi:hypothetical protein